MNEDVELIALYISGDDNALKEIIDKYTPQVYNFVRRFVGSDQVDDITQEVFIKIWKNLGKFNKNKSSFKTWLFTIARNTVIDFTRKRKTILFSSLHARNAKSTAFAGGSDKESNFGENIKDEAVLPDEALQRLQDVEFLNSFLKKLPEQYQSVLILRYQEEMTFEEIGKVLKKPLNTVKSHHLRALGQLRKMIAPKE